MIPAIPTRYDLNSRSDPRNQNAKAVATRGTKRDSAVIPFENCTCQLVYSDRIDSLTIRNQVTSGLASSRILIMLTKCMPHTATAAKQRAAIASSKWLRHPWGDVRRPRRSRVAYDPRTETRIEAIRIPGSGWMGTAWSL
jgi:hypothetical protein